MEEERKVVIELQNVKRYFQVGSETVKALRGVSFKIYEGEFVTIQGTSGFSIKRMKGYKYNLPMNK